MQSKLKMGRSEVLKKTSKVSKISLLEKNKLRKEKREVKKSEAVKLRRKEKAKKEQIEPIDKDGNYVLDQNFEIENNDLLLFEKLNQMSFNSKGLETKIQNFKEEQKKTNPSTDPDVIEVYQKLNK